MISNLSISSKLRVNLVMVGLFFIIFIGLVVMSFNGVKDQFGEVTDDTVPDIIAILELKSLSKRLIAEIQGFVATGEEEEIEEFNSTLETFQVWMSRWEITEGDTEEQFLKNEMELRKEAFRDYSRTIFQLKLQQGDLAGQFILFSQYLQNITLGAWGKEMAPLPVEVAHHLVSNLLLLHTRVFQGLIISKDSGENEVEKETVDDAGAEESEGVEEIIASLLSVATQVADKDLGLRLSGTIVELGEVSRELILGMQMIAEILDKVEEYEDETLGIIDELVHLQTGELQTTFDTTESAINKFTLLLSASGLLFLLVSFAVSRLIDKSITIPLNALNRAVDDVAGGDFTRRAVIHNDDELGKLAKGFNQMTQNLDKTTVSRDFMDNILNSMTESLVVTSPQGVIQSANRATQQLLGYTQGELLGKDIQLLLGNDYTDETGSRREQSLFESLERRGEQSFEAIYMTRDEQKIPVLVSGSFIYGQKKEKQGLVCVAANVSELRQAQEELAVSYEKLKETQEQLIQSSKLASIGELAAGVAHELNQPLMIIRTGSQLLARKRKKGTLTEEAVEHHLNSTQDNSKRMMKIIDHLRTFSRQSSFEFVNVDVHKPIRNSYFLLGEQLRLKNIVVEEKFSTGLPDVLGDINQIEQVILNLLGNARDAIEEKRSAGVGSETKKETIRIETRVAHDDPTFIEIVVKDSGLGIKVDTLGKIFDPFYSTKEIGKGTGLGLSICYGIIKDHNGMISVAETSEEGASFTIRLPAIQ